MNIDKVFSDAAVKILKCKNCQNGTSGSSSVPLSSGNSRNKGLSTTPLRVSTGGNSNKLNNQAVDHGESSDGSSNTPHVQQHRKPPRRKSAKHGLFGRGKGEKNTSRSGPVMIKQGYVQKKARTGTSLRDSKKKFLTLSEDGVLAYFASESDFLEDRDKKSVDVGRTSIKVPGRGGQPTSHSDNEFTVVSSVTADHWVFMCETPDVRDQWVDVIEKMIKSSLSCGSLNESMESRSLTSTGSQPNFDRPGNKACAGSDLKHYNL